MDTSARTRRERLHARFTLSHVQDKADERLRDRWQRRLDAGEDVYCWRCRLRGARTRLMGDRWYLADDARSPECASCHAATDVGPTLTAPDRHGPLAHAG